MRRGVRERGECEMQREWGSAQSGGVRMQSTCWNIHVTMLWPKRSKVMRLWMNRDNLHRKNINIVIQILIMTYRTISIVQN